MFYQMFLLQIRTKRKYHKERVTVFCLGVCLSVCLSTLINSNMFSALWRYEVAQRMRSVTLPSNEGSQCLEGETGSVDRLDNVPRQQINTCTHFFCAKSLYML